MWRFLLFVNIGIYSNIISCIDMNEFKEIDSDFDLAQAIENFRPEDFDITHLEGLKHEQYGGLKFDYNPRRKLPKRTSEEDRKLIEEAFSLINTSSERERQRLLRRINRKEKAENMKENRANFKEEKGKRRVKRDGVGKFSEAAKVSNLKMLRIYLTMFSNLWSKSYLGGRHPLHKNVPKSVMILFKHRIMEFFFPPVGESKV